MLQSIFTMPPFVSQERLNSYARLEAALEGANRRADELQNERDTLAAENATLRSAANISPDVQEGIRKAEQHVFIGRAAMEKAVIDKLVEEARAKLEAEYRDFLRDSFAKKVATDIRLQDGPTILADLRELFENDGTFARIRTKAEAAFRREAADTLHQELLNKAAADLNEPERKAALLAELAAELANDPEIDQHREAYRRKLSKELEEEAKQQAITDAEAEVESQRPIIAAAAQAEWKKSRQGKQIIDQTRKKAEDAIKAMSIDALRGELNDELLAEEMRKKAALETQKLQRNNTGERLAHEFTTGGVDTAAIPAGTTVEIVLGKVKKEQVKTKDPYGYNSTKEADVLERMRRITVVSKGEGLYRVAKDDLADSSNPYSRSAALHEGTIVTLGMLVRHTDASGTRLELDKHIREGATLQYDTNPADPEFTDTQLPVVNVIVNDVAARKFEFKRKGNL